jgi:carbonic anhydrase
MSVVIAALTLLIMGVVRPAIAQHEKASSSTTTYERASSDATTHEQAPSDVAKLLERIRVLEKRLVILEKTSGDPAGTHGDTETGPSPKVTLERMKDGNSRFFGDSTYGPRNLAERRRETSEKGQSPFATVVTCSDSRVPPEMVFDCGLGDLFVVRVAGNVCAPTELGSCEYAVGHLRTRVLVVLGHTRCGAVTAVAEGKPLGGNIASLGNEIRPAVERLHESDPNLKGELLVDQAVRANVFQSVESLLSRSHEIAAAVGEGKLTVIGAVYDIATGQVEWLGAHPQQAQLVTLASRGDASSTTEEHR